MLTAARLVAARSCVLRGTGGGVRGRPSSLACCWLAFSMVAAALATNAAGGCRPLVIRA